MRDERCTLDAPPWAGIGSPLRGWDLDPIVTCVVRRGREPNAIYFGTNRDDFSGRAPAFRFTHKYNCLWVEPFTALHRVSGIRPVL